MVLFGGQIARFIYNNILIPVATTIEQLAHQIFTQLYIVVETVGQYTVQLLDEVYDGVSGAYQSLNLGFN